MAIDNDSFSVTTSATLVSGPPTGGAYKHGSCLKVVSGQVFLGGPSVTAVGAKRGIPWSDTDGLFPMTTRSRLYAITASGTVEVVVLRDED